MRNKKKIREIFHVSIAEDSASGWPRPRRWPIGTHRAAVATTLADWCWSTSADDVLGLTAMGAGRPLSRNGLPAR
jgi:hypothetical protein